MKKPLYKNNPNLKLKIVETFDKSLEYRINCKFINKIYYRINDQIVIISNKEYPINHHNITLDYRINKYVIKNPLLFYGIVDKNNQLGYFSDPLNERCAIMESDVTAINCMNINLIDRSIYKEDLNESIFYKISNIKNINKEEINYLPRISRLRLDKIHTDSYINSKKRITYKDNAYNIEDSVNLDLLKEFYNNNKIEISSNILNLQKHLDNYTFGCEIEVSNGSIQNYYLNKLGTTICKDGSIGYTPEFVTIPLSKGKGLQTIINLFDLVKEKCDTSHHCSLHYHFGNFNNTRQFIVSLYKLIVLIQSDLYQMFPSYKKDPHFLNKEKNYCKPLPDILLNNNIVDFKRKESFKFFINENYKNIFKFLLEGNIPSQRYNKKNKNHPKGDLKWQRNSRYTIVNFMNLFFSNRNTIEFRLHEGTVNSKKAINWFFICLSILKYADKNSLEILKGKKINLMNVLNYFKDYENNPELSETLIEYYEFRKNYYSNFEYYNDDDMDFYFQDDKNYYKNIKLLKSLI